MRSDRRRKHTPPWNQWYKCVYCGMPEYMHYYVEKDEKCYIKVFWREEPSKHNGYAQPWLVNPEKW